MIMSYSATIVKISWFLVCFAANLYQIQQISSDFFNYQIVTTIDVKFPETFHVPAITFCFFEAEIVNWDKLEQVKPDVKEKLNVSSLSDEEIIKKIKLMSFFVKKDYQGIMFQGLDIKTRTSLLYQFHDLFGQCALVEKDGATIKFGNCSDFFDIVTYHESYYVCHSFNFKTDNFTLRYLDSNRADVISGFLYFFRLTKKAVEIAAQGQIIYNENNMYNRFGYFRFMFISELSHLITMNYDEYANFLLPPPYVTKCLSYIEADIKIKRGDEEITDRGSCFESCLKNKSFHHLGSDVSFPPIYIFEDTIIKKPNLDVMTVYELTKNVSMVELKNKLSEECDNLCSSPNCDETLYVPVLRSSMEYPAPAILTYAMQSPKIKTTCEAKLSFIVFLTNVFSTFGFWIGLSLFSIVDVFTDFAMAFMDWIRKQKIWKINSNRNTKNIYQANRHDKSEEKMSTSSHETLSLNYPESSHGMSYRQMRTTRRDRSRTQQTYNDRWRNIENNFGREKFFVTQIRCRRCKLISDEYDKHLTHLNTR